MHNRPEILQYIINMISLEKDTITINARIFSDFGSTALHRAALQGSIECLKILLNNGADPTIKDFRGKTSYDLAKNQNVRHVMRVFAGEHLNQWNWQKAGITPLTPEMEMQQQQKEAEKRKKKKQRQKQKKKELKDKEKLEQDKEGDDDDDSEQEQTQTNSNPSVTDVQNAASFAVLSEREKRARAAENRIAQMAQQASNLKGPRCGFCEKVLPERIPFERLKYKYCSVPCMQRHMDVLESGNIKKV